MPRYFFHVHDGVTRRDTEGTELKDLEEARQEAVQCASEILIVCRDHVCEGHPWQMRVTNEADELLMTLSFQLKIEQTEEAAASDREAITLTS
ncbi:DUF6894 family protein [Lutibaculum baratangense]|uniref:DUF6894 domain-containing protein n=1 Tax=Lutibaculum baratangense AMV1 TaxID=631454 RepID=V4RNF3_9HYPH|nr:hypothetical protein [Lutibaculum baratangense]ESR26809.1 hypothetical protein N177_0593 [Lutibaculum baratangense AMV1]